GQQGSFDDPLKSSRKADRRLQATYPPVGRGTFGKPLPGPNTPLLGPTTWSSQVHPHGNGFHSMHSDSSPVKPRVITVVKPGRQSLRKIKLLLNRRSVQTFEQLVADISEALGFPQWKNDRIRKLYSLKGKEIRSISDFFRGEEVFIAAGRNSLNLKVVQDVLAELYSDNPYAQNLIQQHWECSQKSNFKSFGKASKADSGFDETMIAKPRNGAKTPRQTAKNIENARTQAGQEGRARARKWERERWEKEQNKKRRGKEGNIGRDRSAEWGQEESLDEKGICEKCNEEQRFQKEFQTKKGKDVLSEKKENKMDRDHREHLQLEKRAKSRSGEEEVEDCYETEKEAHQGKEEEEREPTNNHNSVPKEMHASQSELLRSELGKLNSGVEEEAIRNSEMEMHRNEEPGQAKITKRLEKLRNEDTGQTVSREKLEMPRREGSGQTVSREKLEMPRHEGSGHAAVSRKKLEMHRREGPGQTVRPRRVQECHDLERYYKIGRTIGDGNFAIVKECRLLSTDCEYAMKIIDKSKLKGKEDMIENEISIIKSLSHPNIVSLIEEYESEKEIYLILEYVHGGDLFDAITESIKFTEHNAALMITDLCEALSYIHSINIVHRDLKPENLLVQRNADGSTTLKLADFGLGMTVTEPVFTVCGTPTYVAPEILSEKGYGLEVDMWASGVILYILLCGFPPFRSQERDQEELFEIIQLGEYEFLSPYWDNISDAVAAKDLITKLLVVDPKRRYTAQQVLQHPWIKSSGKINSKNLQREVTMNI
uniref:non-specific serine/threonine protein kinase n=1 Tax=Latimeria chalumnae TaxID=7897 RepID=H3A4T6_LATCH